MTAIYNVIGKDIIVNAVVYASDVDEVQQLVYSELQRRGLGGIAVTPIASGNIANASVVTNINSNIRSAGYPGGPISTIPASADMAKYVTAAKELYLKILRY